MPKKKIVRVKTKAAVDSSLPTFESALEGLEQIVVELESGRLSLSDSLSKYEEGIKNLKTCHKILESAENRIRILTGVDDEGKASTRPFDERKTEIHGRSSKRTFRPNGVASSETETESEDDNLTDSDSGGLF
jgi:exodeoxyribonuclease VII small subunit